MVTNSIVFFPGLRDLDSNIHYPVQYGQYLKTLVVYLCVFQILPYDRVSDLFLDPFGRSISKATLVKRSW